MVVFWLIVSRIILALQAGLFYFAFGPWGLLQLTKLREFAKIDEEYLFIMETDHLLLKPLANTATPKRPIGFGFYYMTYRYDPPKLRPVVAKYHNPEAVDPADTLVPPPAPEPPDPTDNDTSNKKFSRN